MILLDEHTIEWSDGDRLAPIALDDGRPVVVGPVREVVGGRVRWDRAEIRLGDGMDFGWGAVAEDGLVLWWTARDQWVTSPRTAWEVVADGVTR